MFRQSILKQMSITVILLVVLFSTPQKLLAMGAGNENLENQALLEQGQELFGRNCQQCHNSRGIGGKCPTLVRGAWAPGGANSDNYMFSIIHDGRDGTQMGAFGAILTREEINMIIIYLRTEAERFAHEDAKNSDDDFERR